MFCQVCRSTLKAGDLYCSACGAVVPGRPSEASRPPSGERKYLTVLCVDLQRSTDLISELDPEAAISRLVSDAGRAIGIADRRSLQDRRQLCVSR